VDDGADHARGRVVPADGVLVLGPGGHPGLGCGLGGEALGPVQLELQSGVPRFDNFVVERGRATPDWRWKPLERCLERLGSVFTVGVRDHPGRLTATDGDGRGQRAVGRDGVVVL
jgi:hypothetical protein